MHRLLCFAMWLLSAASGLAAPPSITTFERAFLPLFSKHLQKSEYETAAQYQDRLAHLTPPGELFIPVDPAAIEYHYQPEAKGLLVAADYREPVLGGGGYLILRRTVLGKTHQTMSNAFGVTVDVEKETTLQYGFNLQTRPPKDIVWLIPDPEIPLPLYSLGLPISLPPDVAQQRVKAKAYTILLGVKVGDLSQAKENRGNTGATLTAPQTTSFHTYDVPVTLQHVLIVHRSTQTVAAAWPALHIAPKS